MAKRLAIILALVLAVAIAGCGKPARQSSGAKSKRTIVFVAKLVGIPYFNSCQKGSEQAGKDLGVNVEFTGPAKGGDVAGQIRIIENQISRGVDAIVISPLDPNSVKPVVEKAMARGIKVFTWDSDAPDTKRLFYVCAADDVGIGTDIMDRLAKDMGGKGKVGIMSGSQGALNLNQHVDGVKIGLKKYPNIEFVGPIINNNDQPQLAQSGMAGLLQAHPDLGGVACVSSPGPPGAARAVIAAGKQGKVKIWGLSTPDENRQYLKDGVVNGLILWDPAKLTYLTAKLVNDYLDGKKPTDGMEVKDIGKLKVSKTGIITMPGLVFTKDNVDQYHF